jgi:hypothetical protein
MEMASGVHAFSPACSRIPGARPNACTNRWRRAAPREHALDAGSRGRPMKRFMYATSFFTAMLFVGLNADAEALQCSIHPQQGVTHSELASLAKVTRPAAEATGLTRLPSRITTPRRSIRRRHAAKPAGTAP